MTGRVILKRNVKSEIEGKYNLNLTIPSTASMMNLLIVTDGHEVRTKKIIINEESKP